ncbi:ABC transporter ATP-binding protein [Corynebacterium sp. B5-R-101]|uniref:ABC transporter ATP-binding protein n=2 Tax=Corynebacterium TaxID=1716 RepID=A0ABU9UGF1_9CORY|nr:MULTISPECIES: ABC transporter ATP-binding protein [Corynebacterium]MCL8493843.1 ABC transporter ATP-binding protein [Corynebacterium intestinale]MCP1390079.1 ABC transporter ATP-binding protein [Corynebacterium intestinale]PKZ25903.1 ABC transporter ATP-binding protein [Corynebacterium aurimucosum]
MYKRRKQDAEMKPEIDINYIEQANVVVDNVSKRYVISQGRSSDASMTRVGRGKTVVDAIVGASLIALPGESIGIIGLNGSGKSTLLSMIAGGLAPTSGRILTRSQPTLMGVSPALQPDLSGEHNIYLGCLALGMSPKDARLQISEIAEWTELGEAIKRPMKTYSSGMSARLSFAISTAVRPDILMIDEALSTGDAAFGAKASARMHELLDRAGNLFLVSHALGEVERNCDRAIWISKGRIIADGHTDIVASQYREWAKLMGRENKDPAHQYIEELAKLYKAPLILLDRAP